MHFGSNTGVNPFATDFKKAMEIDIENMDKGTAVEI